MNCVRQEKDGVVYFYFFLLYGRRDLYMDFLPESVVSPLVRSAV